jgi:hypothetical protein
LLHGAEEVPIRAQEGALLRVGRRDAGLSATAEGKEHEIACNNAMALNNTIDSCGNHGIEMFFNPSGGRIEVIPSHAVAMSASI